MILSTLDKSRKGGAYVKAHTQFKGKKMTVSAVIEYIASHEGWRAEQRSKTTKEKSE